MKNISISNYFFPQLYIFFKTLNKYFLSPLYDFDPRVEEDRVKAILRGYSEQKTWCGPYNHGGLQPEARKEYRRWLQGHLSMSSGSVPLLITEPKCLPPHKTPEGLTSVPLHLSTQLTTPFFRPYVELLTTPSQHCL